VSQNHGGSTAILAVFVGAEAGPVRLAARTTGLHEQQVSLVRDLLERSGGHEAVSPASDACFGFGGWREALEAAMTLTSEIARLPTQPAGVRVGVGLDLSDSPDDGATIERAAVIARSAHANEVRLGEAMAAFARQDPPDRLAIRPVDGDPAPDLENVYRLTNARDAVPNNLVPALTSFVGREAEIGEVRRLLGHARLVTVTGPPGTGKTRLAAEIAERLLGRFEDGGWFVTLAPLSDSRLMLPTLADELGLRQPPDGSIIDAVRLHLQARHVLIVLDNFEHITEAAIELSALLAAAPGLHLLVTSRTRLHLSGEHEYLLPPLELPQHDTSVGELVRSEAVDLFARRAAAAQPTFRVGEENASQVGELCRRLDGLPLAIELAAARVKLLPLPALVARLDHRLALLTGGPRDLPPRHQSLRAAIAWSYDLLEPAAQGLFRRLSVFRGGWTIDGAVAVCGAEASEGDGVFETLGSLLDASLLVRLTPDAEVSRFTMLETLREFAAEQLDEAGEADAVRSRHAAYYLELVERNEPEFTGADQAATLDRVAIEHDNLRTALDYLLGAKPEDALRMGAGMWRFWQMRGHLVEGSRWLTGALQATGEDTSETVRAKALTAAGGLAYWRGDMSETQRYYELALAFRRRIGDEERIADALYDLAFVFAPHLNPPPEDPQRTAQAVRLVDEAEELYRKASNEPGIAKAAWLSGMLMMYRDPDRARGLLGDVVERFRALGDPFGLGWALRMYGLALLGTADSAAAADAFGEALAMFAAAEDGSATGMLLGDFAEVAAAEGDALRAARLKGAAASVRNVTEAELAVVNDAPWRVKAAARDELIDAAALERAWAEGQAMSQAEATAYALRSEAPVVQDGALRVTALGPFLAERSGQVVSGWGGPKAGTRQAQAMFAFLLDRGERGVTKDEFIEVIWPDAEVTQGDLNFHRTLGGLRTTLEPGKASGSSGGVVFANGRYRLIPSIVGWLDATEFEERLQNAAQATDDRAAIRHLEAARSLYRGDYLDDCPLYGDSEYVEERRGFLRGRLMDALVDLGRRYAARGDQTLAAARFREALNITGGDCPAAFEGLERIGVPVA
jgi:predicted ATPase/DNA-binding SARP family transcriptional activator